MLETVTLVLERAERPMGAREIHRAAEELLGRSLRWPSYGKLDADLVRNAAPWAAYLNLLSHDFFSARMGCQVYQPVYGMDLAALCIRQAIAACYARRTARWNRSRISSRSLSRPAFRVPSR